MTRSASVPVVCRRVAGADHGAVREVFEGLSAESRLMRFHVSTPRLRDGQVRALARVRPGVRDAVLAWSGDRPVGHGLSHVLEDGAAELALAVVDPWQGRGVGSALLGHLAETASAAGITRFVCWVHPDNAAVRRRVTRLGGRRDLDDEHAWHLDLARLAESTAPARAGEAA
ncbi:GNAT family N-acetyltransferase [Nocardioides lacusdianchii]|uniref:GNAT family N-acetyltransferase n=1 Tax=Nocardioides lacusdianchii TaxID=2783664 RepID=UPI001CCF5D06|nr:GNAT family N-acetyltransferase [Nocardioides lacusdianchii]